MIPVNAHTEDFEVMIGKDSFMCEISVSATYVFHTGDYQTPSDHTYEHLNYNITKVLDEEGDEIEIEGIEEYVDTDKLEELLDEQNDMI